MKILPSPESSQLNQPIVGRFLTLSGAPMQVLKPTSSLSLIGLKPTYLSLSLSSLYILTLVHVGVTSNPILNFPLSLVYLFFSQQE